MAFPGTYNISYYKGDTLEFNIYPKDSNGDAIDLSRYGEVKFQVSTARGSDGVANNNPCYAALSDDSTYIRCAIRPEDAADFSAGITYVYDVEATIPANTSPYNRIYPITHTFLTGNISVTEQVTGATP